MMRQVVLRRVGLLELEEVPEPTPARGEVLLRVHSVGVCGSDVHGFKGVNSRRAPGMVMGHEAVGVVLSLGQDVEGPAPGTLVAVNPVVGCGACELCDVGLDNLCEERRLYGCVPSLAGAFAEAIVVRGNNVVPIAGPYAEAAGALAEPMAVGYHAVAIGPDPGGLAVLVIGGGPIGVATALAARRAGAASVSIAEPTQRRREFAASRGLEALDPASGGLPTSEFDVAYECVGHSATLSAALGAVRPRGTVVFVGLAEETVQLLATPLVVGERRVYGSSAYTMSDFRAVCSWIESGEADLQSLIQLRVGLEELQSVFEGYATGHLDALKTLVVLGSDRRTVERTRSH